MCSYKLKLFISLILFGSLLNISLHTKTKLLATNLTKIVRVGIYDNKPKVYRDESGTAAGLFPDILDYIAQQENWQLDYVYGTWEEGLDRLEKGKIDIMVDVAISEEREKKFDFAKETVFSSWGIIFVQKNSDIDSFSELDGKKVSILKSSVYLGGPEGVDTYLRAFGLNAEFVNVDEYSEVLDLLDKKKVDAAVVSRVFALTNQKDYPNVKQTDLFFSPTELRFALSKRNTDTPYLIERLDYWTKKLKDGHADIYRESLERNGLAGIITNKVIIPGWVRVVGLTGATVLIISWLLILILKHTKEVIVRELEKKDILLKNVINQTPIIIWAFDEIGNITLAEGKGLEDANIKKEFIVGQSLSRYLAKDSFSAEQLKKAFSGEPVEFKAKIAEKMWRLSLSPVKVDDTVKSIVGVAVDLTKEFQLDQAETEFLTIASHYLRTVPSGIKWTIELLSPKVEKILDNEELLLWKNLGTANTRMIDLARTLSMAAELELGKIVMQPEKFNLQQLIDDECTVFEELIVSKNLEIIKNYGDIKEIVQDKVRVKLIVNTLLSNAIKYISSEGSIEISLLPKGDMVIIKIKDTGWGIPKNQQSEVFTKMFRADNVTKQDVRGLGLGLFIAKSIAQKLGGTIWFESIEGEGSTFYFRIPYTQKNV